MAKINKPKEEIDYAKVDKLTNEIAKKLKEIRDLYLKEYPQGDYMSLTIWKNYILFHNARWDEDRNFPIYYDDYAREKEWEYGKK